MGAVSEIPDFAGVRNEKRALRDAPYPIRRTESLLSPLHLEPSRSSGWSELGKARPGNLPTLVYCGDITTPNMLRITPVKTSLERLRDAVPAATGAPARAARGKSGTGKFRSHLK